MAAICMRTPLTKLEIERRAVAIRILLVFHLFGGVTRQTGLDITLVIESECRKRPGFIAFLTWSDQFDIGHIRRLVVAITAVKSVGHQLIGPQALDPGIGSGRYQRR